MKWLREQKKNIFNISFLLIVFVLTFYFILKDQEISDIFEVIERVNKGYLVAGVVLLLAYVCGEAVVIYYLLYRMGQKASILQCIRYSFIGFFFSCLTPSASGGQPAQMYYMKRDDIPISMSSLILMLVTITYKAVLIVVGVVILIIGNDFIKQYLGKTVFFFYLGMGLNIIGVGAMLLLVFDAKLAKIIVMFLLKLLEKMHLLKPNEKRTKNLSHGMDKYHEAAGYIKGNLHIIVQIFFITLVQRICLFAVTYLIYLSFGFHEAGAVLIISLSAVISIGVDMLPLPGGMGASESLFLHIFEPFFSKQLILPAMLLSRGISYYGLLVVSAGVTCASQLIGKKKERSL